MKIFYRLSDGSYPKERFEHATKELCLQNFLKHFCDPDDHMFLYLDNVKDATFEKYKNFARLHTQMAISNGATLIDTCRTDGGSSAAGFREVFEDSLIECADDEVVYFVEDDYAHLENSRKVLLEGVERADYVTLYNHPDKYIPASKGGNPLIGDDGAEATRVFATNSSYWMMTNSTTMTFATKMGTLKEDAETWRKFTMGVYPHDMKIFLELREKGRTLIQPIPTKATHCEPRWAAHLHGTKIRGWDELLKPITHIPEPRQYTSF